MTAAAASSMLLIIFSVSCGAEVHRRPHRCRCGLALHFKSSEVEHHCQLVAPHLATELGVSVPAHRNLLREREAPEQEAFRILLLDVREWKLVLVLDPEPADVSRNYHEHCVLNGDLVEGHRLNLLRLR